MQRGFEGLPYAKLLARLFILILTQLICRFGRVRGTLCRYFARNFMSRDRASPSRNHARPFRPSRPRLTAEFWHVGRYPASLRDSRVQVGPSKIGLPGPATRIVAFVPVLYFSDICRCENNKLSLG